MRKISELCKHQSDIFAIDTIDRISVTFDEEMNRDTKRNALDIHYYWMKCNQQPASETRMFIFHFTLMPIIFSAIDKL